MTQIAKQGQILFSSQHVGLKKGIQCVACGIEHDAIRSMWDWTRRMLEKVARGFQVTTQVPGVVVPVEARAPLEPWAMSFEHWARRQKLLTISNRLINWRILNNSSYNKNLIQNGHIRRNELIITSVEPLPLRGIRLCGLWDIPILVFYMSAWLIGGA